jgi:hypothetical protein
MKTSNRLPTLLLATFGLAVASLAAADQNAGPFAIHVTSLVNSNTKLLVADGDTEDTVRSTLGSPDSIVLGDVWIYRRFADRQLQQFRYVAQNQSCDTLLIAFTSGATSSVRRVVEIAMVNAAAVEPVAAGLQADPRYLAKQVAANRGKASATTDQRDLPYLVHITKVVTNDNTVLFRDGDSEDQVRRAVGQPTEILPGEVWAFRQFERHSLTEVRQGFGQSGCNLTLVSFSPGMPGSGRTVTAIVTVNPASLDAVVAALKLDPDYLVKRVQGWHENAM